MQINLRGAVLGNFKSISSFAATMGWNKKKASEIVNGTRQPNAKEMIQISDALGIDNADAFMALFFDSKYAK